MPRESLGDALDEIVDRFGTASFEPVAVEGYWRHEGITYNDSLAKIIIDVEDNDDNRQWMRDYKTRWKKNLAQLELWLVSYEIDVE